MSEVECEICARHVPVEQTQKVCAVHVCDRCFKEEEHRLGELSRFGEFTWRTGADDFDPDEPNRNRHTFVRVRGTVKDPSGVEAAFSKEPKGLGSLFLRAFGKKARELQIGDPLFDDNVLIRTSTADVTAAFLASEPVQTAILDFAGHGGTVVVNDRTMEATVRKVSSGFKSVANMPWIGELLLSGGILFARFARFTQTGNHTGPDDDDTGE